jgi:3-oxoacyl-[acyl-carrier-protein] synthase-3
MSIRITSAGHYYPDTVLDNSFFESLDIETNDEWIATRTGINERRTVLSHADIKDQRHGKITMDQICAREDYQGIGSFIKPAVDMLKTRDASVDVAGFTTSLCTTIFGQTLVPANASIVADCVGANQAVGMDYGSACSSFVTGLRLAVGLLHIDPSEKVLLTLGDRLTTMPDYNDRSSCILFGDSSAAFAVENTTSKPGLELVDSIVCGDNAGWSKIHRPRFGGFSQDGRVVQKFAVQKTIDLTQKILEKNDLSIDTIQYFIAHQANGRMLDFVEKSLEIDPAKHLRNVDTLGNQGGSGAAVALSQGWDSFKPGDKVVVTVVGAGLTWGSLLLEYKA